MIAIFFVISFVAIPAYCSPSVKISNGRLNGTQLPEAQAFFSIPYAKPPVGNLRFQNPIPIGYHGDLDVSNNTGVGCMSLPLTCSIGHCAKFVSEDCLFLNVYVPKSVNLTDPKNPPQADLPVLVWFHGGAFSFESGLSPLYDGRYMAEAINAIVITLNYRIMPFGFLTLGAGSSSVPGNMGLRDQQVALQWIQENIAAFGGNSREVTIWGQSAGAQSVALHLISSVSAPLFSRGVMDSNPASFTYKTAEEARKEGMKFAKYAGCLCGSYDCLVNKSSDEIIAAFQRVKSDNLDSGDLYSYFEPFSPILDGEEFTQLPVDAFKDGNWSTNMSFMIGTNFQETYSVYTIISDELPYELFSLLNDKIWPAISSKVTHLYAPDTTLPDYRNALGDMLTHFVFTCSSRYLARSGAATTSITSDVYYYTNYHPLNGTDCPKLLGDSKIMCGYCFHGAELSYFWRSGPSVGHHYMTEEKGYVNAWSSYLGNFVHSGNPNKGLPEDVQENLGNFVNWPAYKSSEKWKSSKLITPKPEVEQEPLDHYCSFWDEIGYDSKVFGKPIFAALKEAYAESENHFFL